MSFLNPVNESVLRFSSTDADAPQINYNSRTAGDVKAVLKACLVTGYGTTVSAGWSVVNETGNVAEFVSPSAAMSDYRLGIDDTSTANTIWYYQYQDARTNPRYNTPTKSFSNVDKSHLDNGWQLLVTDRGFYFIEILYSPALEQLTTRMTAFTQVKLGLIDTSKNISFFNAGNDGAYLYTRNIFNSYNYISLDIAATNPEFYGSAVNTGKGGTKTVTEGANIDVSSEVYIVSSDGIFCGQQPALLIKQLSKTSDMYGVRDIMLEGRPCLEITLGARTETKMTAFGVTVLLRLDEWGY